MLAAIIVVKERWIEAAAVEVNGIGPVAVNARTGDQIIMEVAHRRSACAGDASAAESLHVRVNQPEQPVRVAQARRPDAAGIGIAEHVQLSSAVERAREESPVDEIARV